MAQLNPYILVLGGSDDGQLGQVVEQLRKRHADVVFIDHNDPCDVSLDVSDRGEVTLHFRGESMRPPALVWSRLKINTLLSDWGEGAADEYVRRAEWRGFLVAVANFYSKRSIFPLSNAWRAEGQLEQFAAAGRAGFSVPESRMFVGKSAALSMAQRIPSLVAKPIAARNVPKLAGPTDAYRVLLTMAVDADALSLADDADFNTTPTYFQERIASGVEHRVIAFRDRAFSYAIKQRVETRTRPDERMLYGGEIDGRRIYGAQYAHVETSAFVASATSSVLVDLGLEYGAFDIILTDDGDHVFLECNPEGQWYAARGFNLDEVTGHFADVIIDRFNQNCSEFEPRSVGSPPAQMEARSA